VCVQEWQALRMHAGKLFTSKWPPRLWFRLTAISALRATTYQPFAAIFNSPQALARRLRLRRHGRHFAVKLGQPLQRAM